MVLQRSKSWREKIKITFILVCIFKNSHASKASDQLPLNKVSLTFWYRSQAIRQKFFDFPRVAPQQRRVFLAFCQKVENGCAREVLMPVSLRSSLWHQEVVTDSWCEIKCQLVFGAQKSLHAMTKRNVCHYIGQTKPVDHPALWIPVEVNHIHRMILRLKTAVFIELKKLLQSEFIFVFLNCREADINFDLPGNSLCCTTKRRQAFSRRSCDSRKFVGALAYNNRFWRAPVAKVGSNVVRIQHIKIIRGRQCGFKHMLLEFHTFNCVSIWRKRTEVCWVRSDALHGSIQLFLYRDFGCPRWCFFLNLQLSLSLERQPPQ